MTAGAPVSFVVLTHVLRDYFAQLQRRGYCTGPLLHVASTGGRAAACPKCHKRVAVTTRGHYRHHKPPVEAAAVRRVETADTRLEAHMRRYRGELGALLNVGTFASEEFDRLYNLWIRARWDTGDVWVRSIWKVRP